MPLADVVQVFFRSIPGWIRPLVRLRNCKAGSVGRKPLNSVHAQNSSLWYDHRAGEFVSLPLQLFSHAANEVVLGKDIKHVSFRVSFFMEQQTNNPQQKVLTITTMVQYNNSLGKMYFLLMRPLYKLLVPVLLRNTVHVLETEHPQTQPA